MKTFLDAAYGVACCMLYAMAALGFIMAVIYGLGCVPSHFIEPTICAICGMGFGGAFLILWDNYEDFYATLCK